MDHTQKQWSRCVSGAHGPDTAVRVTTTIDVLGHVPYRPQDGLQRPLSTLLTIDRMYEYSSSRVPLDFSDRGLSWNEMEPDPFLHRYQYRYG